MTLDSFINFSVVRFYKKFGGDLMALIPRRKKRNTIDNNIDAKWEVYAEREQFKLLIDGSDISDKLVIELVNGIDMVAFNPETSYYYLLKNFENVAENELQDVTGFKSDSGVAFISYNDFDTYHFFLKGEIISSDSISFWCDDDLVYWIPQTEEYYLFERSNTIVDEQILVPTCLSLPNQTLWIKNDGYYLFNCGERVNTNSNMDYIGDTMVICDVENRQWYQLTDYKEQPIDTYFSARVLDFESAKLWAKTPGKGNFNLLDKGLALNADDMKAVYTGDSDALLYIKAEGYHYLLENFRNSEIGELCVPILLPNNTKAIWKKPAQNKFNIIVEGNDISNEVDSKFVDNNLVLHYQKTCKLYVCLDYRNQSIDQFQPAVIMDA